MRQIKSALSVPRATCAIEITSALPFLRKNTESCFLSYISTISCSHCKNSILTFNGKCTTHKRCSDPNCEICYMWDTNESCYICKKGYLIFGESLKEAPCVPQVEGTTGCY